MTGLSPSVTCKPESLNLETFLELGGVTTGLDVDELLVSSKVFSPFGDGTTPEASSFPSFLRSCSFEELLSETGTSGALCGSDSRLSGEEESSKCFSSLRNSSA